MATAIANKVSDVMGASSTIPLIIDNANVTTSDSFAVSNPATGQVIHKCSSASIADIDKALASAQKAFPAWKALPPQKKRDILLKAADILESRTEEITEYAVQETGCDKGWGQFNVTLAADIIRDCAGKTWTVQGSIPQTGAEDTAALVLREPLGTILAIAPWNAPFILGVRAIVFPIAAGNCVIDKAPELSPKCTWAIVDSFHKAGLPAGVLNLVAHSSQTAAEITKYLIQNPAIKKVNFTGSTAVGRIIAAECGKNLKPVLLELGGKAPAIVWEDADIQLAAKEVGLGAFLHSGQICMSTERVIVHEAIADKFVQALSGFLNHFSPADKDAGVLINKAGVEKNHKLLADAVSKGAEIVHGDAQASEDQPTKMRPVVVKGTSKEMDLYYTESFGPTTSIITVKTEEEALEIANDTEYGLSSAVFSKDLGTALRIAKRIETGAVHINSMSVHDEPALPHGGVKASGYGRFSGTEGIAEWTRTKTVTYKI